MNTHEEFTMITGSEIKGLELEFFPLVSRLLLCIMNEDLFEFDKILQNLRQERYPSSHVSLLCGRLMKASFMDTCRSTHFFIKHSRLICILTVIMGRFIFGNSSSVLSQVRPKLWRRVFTIPISRADSLSVAARQNDAVQ